MLVMTNPLFFGFCRGVSSWSDGTKYCYSSVTDNIPETLIVSTGLISIFLLVFTFLTYRMREEVFHAWWNFARWMVPIIILATFAVNALPSNGGFFNMDALAYPLFLGPLYLVLIVVSLWKIVRAYRRK